MNQPETGLPASPDARHLAHIDHLERETDRMAAIVARAAPELAVPGCPGWDLRALTVHTGMVQRWAHHVVAHGRPPEAGELPIPGDEVDLGAWLRAGAAELAEVLRTAEPTGPTWHPFPVDRTIAVWSRRMAHEVAMHRTDAARTTGGDATLDPTLASDGIDEYFEVGLPRVLQREELDPPARSLHVHCTDVAGEWLVSGEGGEYRMVREHAKGDAALRGAAGDLLAVLMHRADVGTVDTVGDPAAVSDWLSLPGW